MQFTTFLTTFFFMATALAAPAMVPDPTTEAKAGSQTEVQSGSQTWEFRPFTDGSCQNSPPSHDVLSGPQTPGSQCINVTDRIGAGVYAAHGNQVCKIYAFFNGNINCSGTPGTEALLSDTCSPYPSSPISSIRVDC